MGPIKIYILHGWTYTTTAWDTCLSHLRQKGFEPIMLNVPGLTTEEKEVYTVDMFVAWLKSHITEPSIIVGHSNGGKISIAFAALYPDLVRALILIGSSGIPRQELSVRIKRALGKTVSSLQRYIPIPANIKKNAYRIFGASDYGNASPIMKETMKHMLAYDARPQASKITCPTLLIWGERDRATPVADGYLFHQLISGSTLKVISGAGHSPHKSHPDIVAHDIENFIK